MGFFSLQLYVKASFANRHISDRQGLNGDPVPTILHPITMLDSIAKPIGAEQRWPPVYFSIIQHKEIIRAHKPLWHEMIIHCFSSPGGIIFSVG